MTLVPMYKTCSRCKRKYSWNPDVGQISGCPYCRWNKFKKIFSGKKK